MSRLVAPRSSLRRFTTRANVAPASTAWLPCHPAFCHRGRACVISSRHGRVGNERLANVSEKRPGCIPPQMSPALTALPVRRGRRCSLWPRRIACPQIFAPMPRIFPRRHGTIERRTHPDTAMKRFADLSEQEVLALAITNEEEDSRIYQRLRRRAARAVSELGARCSTRWRRRRSSIAACCTTSTATKFGEYLPLIRRQDVKGFVRHKPLWLVRPLGLDEVRKYAAEMEFETARFYRKAAETGARRLGARAAGQARRGRGQAREPRRGAGREDPDARARAPRRTRPRGACSCCNTCSRASPA